MTGKIIALTAVAFLPALASAQAQAEPVRDTAWKVNGLAGISASQTELSNWQGGGQSNVALNAVFNMEVVYRRDEFEQWTNKIDAQYGIVKPGGVTFRKNADQLFALSKYDDLAFGKKWFWAVQADYRTQFAPGYKYAADSIVGRAESDFNSPGYVQLALGLDYKPADYFSVMISPLAAKLTMVNRQYLADEGAFGVQKATYDATGNMTAHGKKFRLEPGARVVMKFKKDIVQNVNLDSYLDLFTSYTNHPGNVDVVFNNMLTVKLNRFISASIISKMIYDDDVTIHRDFNGDGKYDGPSDINGPRLQLLTTFAVGLAFKF